MPARFEILIDDGQARGALQRLRDDIERTASFVSSKSITPGGVGAKAADDLARSLGVARSDVVTAVRQSNFLLDPAGRPLPGGGGGGGGGGDPFGHNAHSIGLQSVAHSARAVADTYAYRVSPAIAEVHRAAAGFLAFSVPGFGALAAIGLSAATLIGINLAGSFLKASEASKELSLANRAAREGDTGGLEKSIKERRDQIVKLEEDAAEASHKAVIAGALESRRDLLPEEFQIPGILFGAEAEKAQKEAERKRRETSNAEEVFGFYASAALLSKHQLEQNKEAREVAKLGVAEIESGNRAAFDLTRSHVAEQAKLADGERNLRLERIKATAEFAEGEGGAGRLGLVEVQRARRLAIEEKSAEDLLAVDEEATKKRTDLVLQQTEIETQIQARQAFLAAEGGRLTKPQRTKEELEITERQAKARALAEQLANVDAEAEQKRRGVGQRAKIDLAKDDQRQASEAVRQEEQTFALKRALREADLQDELRRLEALIGATEVGSARRLQLETELAEKKKQVRDKAEASAVGIIGQAGALLKSQGIDQVTSEQLGQTFDQLSQKHQQTLQTFKAGGAVSPEDLSAAIQFQKQLRDLQDLGVTPGGTGGFLQQAVGEDADKAYWDQWYGERLKSGVSVPSFGAAPSLNFPSGGTSEAAIRQQLGLGPVPNINADLVVEGFDGAWKRIRTGFGEMLSSMENEAATKTEGVATAIEDRVLARLRETLYRDFQRQ